MKYRKIINNASLTVEAALVFPVFFFTVLVFLYLFRILYLQEHIQHGLMETVERMSRHAYLSENFINANEDVSVDGMILGDGWMHDMAMDGILAMQFRKDVNLNMLDRSCIKGGSKGISFGKSSVMVLEKEIDAIAEYKITIPVPLLSLIDIPMCQRIKSRGFVGREYDEKGSGDKDKTMVYVTPTGTAYHQVRDCTYIKIILLKELYGNLDNMRNESGGIYYPCERCVNQQLSNGSGIYITSYGTRYHLDNTCSSIKRTVMAIPRSEVGERHACSKCWD